MILARRSVAYSYAIRYFLKVKSKCEFFDYLQEEAERYLEYLSKESEKDWMSFIETSLFDDYIQKMYNLKSVLQKNFEILND